MFVSVQDTGLRPDEVFRMRVENINWSARAYFNASGKTKRSRRWVPLSQRVLDLLLMRCGGRQEGWAFASKRSKTGHLTTIAKKFREARKANDASGY